MTREEAWLRFEEKLRQPIPLAKPKPVAVLVVPVSDKIAAAAKASPETVRVSARDVNGLHIVEGPRRNPQHVTVCVDWVREVDASGQPIWGRSGAVHEYQPLDALRRD